MKEFQYTVKDACGIHARPAGLLVKVVKGFSSTATLEKNGKTCDLRKLMALSCKVSVCRSRGRRSRSDPEVPERERLSTSEPKPLRELPAGAFSHNGTF